MTSSRIQEQLRRIKRNEEREKQRLEQMKLSGITPPEPPVQEEKPTLEQQLADTKPAKNVCPLCGSTLSDKDSPDKVKKD